MVYSGKFAGLLIAPEEVLCFIESARRLFHSSKAVIRQLCCSGVETPVGHLKRSCPTDVPMILNQEATAILHCVQVLPDGPPLDYRMR